MEEAKTRNLYADLGLADTWASLGEIDLAYMQLMSKLADEVNPAAAPADAAELSKIHSAYEILRDPEKRAEYNKTRIDFFNYKNKSVIRRKYKAGWRWPLDQMLRAARMQLESKAWQTRRTRLLPQSAQLRAKAQLRAHAHHLDLFHALSRSHGNAAAIRHVGLGPVDEVPQYWAMFDPTSDIGKRMGEKHGRGRREARERARAALVARQEAMREEEAAREKAAAENDRANEIKWIKQEAKESIAMLAGMAQLEYPVSELGGYELALYEQSVGQMAERADDLLEYLWDKVHSGTWTIPTVKEGLDLDQLLRSVWQPEAPNSYQYFPKSTQQLAATLLRKVRGQNSRETDDSMRRSSTSTPEVDDKSCYHSSGSAVGSSLKGQVPRADSQPHHQTPEPKRSSFPQNVQPRPSFVLEKRQSGIGNLASITGSKRKRSLSDDQGSQRSKNQKMAPMHELFGRRWL